MDLCISKVQNEGIIIPGASGITTLCFVLKVVNVLKVLLYTLTYRQDKYYCCVQYIFLTVLIGSN